MFNFFFKRQQVNADISFIKTDMHSHLLPGIDDGVPQKEQSIQFMQALMQLGYTSFICTPHILHTVHNNSKSTILPALQTVQTTINAAGLDIKVSAAAEYMVDEYVEQELKKTEEVLHFNKNVLIEMSYAAPSPNIEEVLFNLKLNGWQPVLAHPERYNYFHDKWTSYERLIDMGCEFQLNLLSLSDYYGPSVKAMAEKLIKKQMVHWLGTDLHHQKHLRAIQLLLTEKRFYDLLKDVPFKNASLVMP